MAAYPRYLTFYVLERNISKTAIHKVSLDENQAKFTGAWVISDATNSEILEVIGENPIYIVGTKVDLPNETINMEKFISIARDEADNTITIYEAYKSEDPKKRKNLVVPELWDWPNIDFSDPKNSLNLFGVRDSIPNTDKDFENVLTTSRLIKFVFDKWYQDEIQRNSKKYLSSHYTEIRVAPPGWLRNVS